MGYLAPKDNSISLGARGLLAVMANDIYSDYCKIEDIYHTFPTEDKTTINDIINELCEKEYILEYEPKHYAMNKMKIHTMTVVGGTETPDVPCYFMPKKFLLDDKIKKYSSDSKLLAGIMLSSASSGEVVTETASLINDLDSDYISEIVEELRSHGE